jgi:hypothetical protein
MRSWACTQAWPPCSDTRELPARTGSCEATRRFWHTDRHGRVRYIPRCDADRVHRGSSNFGNEEGEQHCTHERVRREHTLLVQTDLLPNRCWTRAKRCAPGWKRTAQRSVSEAFNAVPRSGSFALTMRSVTNSNELTKPPTTVRISDERNSVAKICSTAHDDSSEANTNEHSVLE